MYRGGAAAYLQIAAARSIEIVRLACHQHAVRVLLSRSELALPGSADTKVHRLGQHYLATGSPTQYNTSSEMNGVIHLTGASISTADQWSLLDLDQFEPKTMR